MSLYKTNLLFYGVSTLYLLEECGENAFVYQNIIASDFSVMLTPEDINKA